MIMNVHKICRLDLSLDTILAFLKDCLAINIAWKEGFLLEIKGELGVNQISVGASDFVLEKM